MRSEKKLAPDTARQLNWQDFDTLGVAAAEGPGGLYADYRKSFSGSERDQLFWSQAGEQFVNLSGLSGLDALGDGRSLAFWDFDRDGWTDPVLTQLGEPALVLFHNDLPEHFPKLVEAGRTVALRLVGGNRTSAPHPEWSPREAYGAVVRLKLPDATIVRELHCGEGYNAQNSRTVLIGIGAAPEVPRLEIRWPSGRTTEVRNVAAGTLLTVFENPAEAAGEGGVRRETYRRDAAAGQALRLAP